MSKISWKPGNMLYPLPACIVTCAQGEVRNAITVAWTGTICSEPAMTYVSIRKERFSHDIIAESGEFVINLVGRNLVREMDSCGILSGRDGDKFERLGIETEPATKVSAPLIARSPVSIECRVTQSLPLGSHTMFLAEVIAVDVDESLLDQNNKLCLEKADLIAYSHGAYYTLQKEMGRFGYSVKKTKGKGKK